MLKICVAEQPRVRLIPGLGALAKQPDTVAVVIVLQPASEKDASTGIPTGSDEIEAGPVAQVHLNHMPLPLEMHVPDAPKFTVARAIVEVAVPAHVVLPEYRFIVFVEQTGCWLSEPNVWQPICW